MTAQGYVQQTRLVAKHTQSAIQRWIKNVLPWKSRISDSIFRFARESTRSISQFGRSLALARAFYPTLAPAPPADEAKALPTPDSEGFDPLVVRSVPRSLHALIRLRVAIRLGAAQMATQNALTCQREGWNLSQVSAATTGYGATEFNEMERLVLRFADDLTRTPMDVDLATLRQLHLHFSNDQVIELAASTTQENYRARFRTALELAAAKAAI